MVYNMIKINDKLEATESQYNRAILYDIESHTDAVDIMNMFIDVNEYIIEHTNIMKEHEVIINGKIDTIKLEFNRYYANFDSIAKINFQH